MTTSALASALALATQLAGPGAAPVPAPQAPKLAPPQAAAPAAPDVPVKLGEVALSAVAARQAQAADALKVGPAVVSLSADFPTEDGLSLAFSQADKTVEASLDEVKAGAAVELPYGHYKASLFAGAVEVTTPDASLGRAKLSILLSRAQQKTAQLAFGPVVYGALLEGTPDAPQALALIRRDDNGQYWVAWHSSDELKNIVWLLAVDGKMVGIKLEGDKLAVYGQPVPQLPFALMMDGAKALSLH